MSGSHMESTVNGPHQSAETTSVMRTNKARALAAQFLWQECENPAPLLPLDPSQRISLHRQLRSRYIASQIPFSALSCSRYITASDVAQLASTFHKFNLFAACAAPVERPGSARPLRNITSPVTVDGQATAPGPTASSTQAEGRGAARTLTKATSERRAARVASPASSSTPPYSVVVPPRVTGAVPPAVSSWRLGECAFRGDGMTLLRDVAEPLPPRVMVPVSPFLPPSRSESPSFPRLEDTASFQSLRSMLPNLANSGGFGSSMQMTAATALQTMSTGTAAAAAAAAVAADGCDHSEAFTSVSGDCAMATDWVVEVLLGMILVNYDAASHKGSRVGADDCDSKGAEKQLMGASLHMSSGQTRIGDYGNSSIAAMNMNMGVAGHSLHASSHQARGRDSRTNFMCSVKAELTAWAEQLEQTCDQREHLVTWQQCSLQREVLERYQLCVVNAARIANLATLHPSALKHTSEGLPLWLSMSATHSPDVGVADAAAPAEGGVSVAGPLPTTCGNPPRSRRANVSWNVLDATVNPAAPASAATQKWLETRSAANADVRDIAVDAAAMSSSPSPRGTVTSSAPRLESPWLLREDAELTEVFGVFHAAENPTAGLAPLLEYSIQSLNMDTATSAVSSTETTAFTTTDMPGMESNYLAAKARRCAPEFRELLRHPAELNAFLWELPAAHVMTAGEGQQMQQWQQSRTTRGAKLSTTASGATDSWSQSTADAPRTLSRDEVSARVPPRPQQPRRRRAAAEQHLICWSDVVSNLLMGLETTWKTQQHDMSYVRVQTTLLEDMVDGTWGAAPDQHRLQFTPRPPSAIGVTAAATGSATHTSGQPDEYDEDENDDSADEGHALSLGAASKGGQCRRRRQSKAGGGTDAVALQQRATLMSNLGEAAEAALRALHSHAADHVIVSPSQKYIVTSSKEGMVKVWETSRGQFVDNILNVGQAWVLHMCFLHGGEYLLVATSAAEITVVNFPMGGVVTKLRGCTSLATAIVFVKQPSTVNTQRYGLKPGECGLHKPVTKQGTSAAEYHAAAAVRLEKHLESENVPIAARPLIGYVTPTTAFYEEELGQLFFGTLSGMVGCVDLSEPLSHSSLLAAAAGARWKGALHLHSCVYAHHDVPQEREGPSAPAAATTTDGGGSPLRAQPGTFAGSDAAPVGLRVNGVFYCGVGHCVISSDCAGRVVRTSFTVAADTLAYSLGTPEVVMDIEKPILFMVCCPGGRRFVTVHSDRRALLWVVGRTTTELVHQYPQEAYDIVDACFFTHVQQVALLMADCSIHMFDERGTRIVSSIQLRRGFISRAEDIASVTLKYSANDGEGCLAYLPDARRIVCGLRGPVLYEPAVRSSGPEKASPTASATGAATEEVRQRRGSVPGGARDVLIGSGGSSGDAKARVGGGASRRGSTAAGASVTFLQVSFAPTSPCKLPGYRPTCVDSTPPTAAVADGRVVREQAASTLSMLSSISESGELDDQAYERARLRLRRQMFAAALLKAQQRLLPYQTHTSAVVGILLSVDRHELHTISTDTWTVWNYETGARVRMPVQVPAAAERELALRRRACWLTCCAWSSGRHTRLLLGTRVSRVLTLDATVGSVVSVTAPLQQRGGQALDDKDVSVIACCGIRTILCSGRVCEVRRYELAGTPLPSGEERFVSMQVQLPTSTASAGAAPAESGGAVGEGKVKAGKSRGGSSSATPRTRLGPNTSEQTNALTTTITACCVVRESFLCVGTSDTQLFFYRLVDYSNPIQVEVLCDASGEPDVGRVISLHYVHNKAQDMLLAVVDTGVLYSYSFTLQRMIARYSFPGLGMNLLNVAAPAGRRGRMGVLRPPQSHYLTSVALIDDATSSAASASALPSTVFGAAQRQLKLCGGDSAGYVHVASLTGLFADASAAAAGSATKAPMKNRDMRVVASFRAATSGVSALAAMKWSRMNASATEETLLDVPHTPTRDPASLPALVIFAGSFDGNVRLFCLTSPPPNSRCSSSQFVTMVEGNASKVFPLSNTSPRGAAVPVIVVPEISTFTPTSATTPTSPLSRSPCSFANGTVHSAVAPLKDVRSDGASCSAKNNSIRSTTSTSPSPLATPYRATGLLNATPLLTVGGMSTERITASAVNSEGDSRPVLVTVGLCGVDTWDLCDMDTFTDVKQEHLLADFAKKPDEEDSEEAEEPMRLPSVLDEAGDKRPDKENMHNGASGADPAVAADVDAARRGKAGAAGAAAGGSQASVEPRDDGAVLLSEVLRQSKKRLPQHSAAAATVVVGSVEDHPECSPAAAAQRRSSPTTARSSASVNATVVMGKAFEGKRLAAPADATPAHSAPPLHTSHTVGGTESHAGETLALSRPHTIDEVISDSRTSTSKGLMLPHIKTRLTVTPTTAVASSFDEPEGSASLPNNAAMAKNECSALTSSRGPQPRPFPFRNQQNPLLHTYPVALLRQMGVLPPQDETADVDPATQQPALLSAKEAFQRWRKTTSNSASFRSPEEEKAHLMSATVRFPTLTERGLLSNTRDSADEVVEAEAPSSSSTSCSFLHGGRWSRLRCGTAVADDGAGERCHSAGAVSFLPSPGHGSGRGDGQKASVPADRDAAVRSTNDDDDDGSRDDMSSCGGGEDSRDHSARHVAAQLDVLTVLSHTAVEGGTVESPVFLTEGPAHGGPELSISGSSAAISTVLPATHMMGYESALSATEIERKTPQTPTSVSASALDVLELSTFSVPPVTDEVNVRQGTAQQAQAPCGVTGEPPRLRRLHTSHLHTETNAGAGMMSPLSTTFSQPHTRAQRELALMRGALQGVDPQMLKMREDQMMLCHAAGQLDRALRRPVSPTGHTCGPTTAYPKLGDGHGSSGRTLGVGEFTARLLRGWRQRSGDSAVQASMTLLQRRQRQRQLQASGGAHASPHNVGDISSGGFGGGSADELTSAAAGSFLVSRYLSDRDRLSGDPVYKPGQLPSNLMMAVAASQQAASGAGFGLPMWPLMVPNEPPPPSATPASSARSLPKLGVQQELHPIRVTLPCTMQNDEGERMLLRRFEAAVNERSVKGQR